jgi:hypothetical protein
MFAVDGAYVKAKLRTLLWAPRGATIFCLQSALHLNPRGTKHVHAPDLYIPVVGIWTYILLDCVFKIARGKKEGGEAFRGASDVHNSARRAFIAWALNIVCATALFIVFYARDAAAVVPKKLKRVENLLILSAYTGYAFANASVAIIARAVVAYVLLVGKPTSYYLTMPVRTYLCLGYSIYSTRAMTALFSSIPSTTTPSTTPFSSLFIISLVCLQLGVVSYLTAY